MERNVSGLLRFTFKKQQALQPFSLEMMNGGSDKGAAGGPRASDEGRPAVAVGCRTGPRDGKARRDGEGGGGRRLSSRLEIAR
ncbi:hypothetical protein GQ55_3G114400 [Panicum hallii var. hallii]|uniref:Uncharacterized protein n=1 Tax=Panicum hallii var. hallii TaxID=1504633 RepID=A0A2T7E8B6_9POAL|nr:hypothetical protein GQ55_3G114400 [Panicum hallii var. hallii]